MSGCYRLNWSDGITVRARDRSRVNNVAPTRQSTAISTWQSPPPLVQQRDTARHALSVLVGKGPADWVAPDFDLTDFTLPSNLPVSLPSEVAHSRPAPRCFSGG
jgi:hypothetical protein